MAYIIPWINKSFDLLVPYLFINYLIKPILCQIVFTNLFDKIHLEIPYLSQNEKPINLDLKDAISK